MAKILSFKGAKYLIDGKYFFVNDLVVNSRQNLIRINAPNGFGKTMFINFICGIYKPIEGEIENSIDKYRSVLVNHSYLGLSNKSLDENMKWLIEDIYSLKYVQVRNELIKLLNVDKFKNEEYGKLSTGTKQKINVSPLFCTSIIDRCNLFIIDEIFTGLDQDSQTKLIEQIGSILQANKTVILIEHNKDIVDQISSYSNIIDEINIDKNGNIFYAK